jgi:Recombinase zinc beta ribbon domain
MICLSSSLTARYVTPGRAAATRQGASRGTAALISASDHPACIDPARPAQDIPELTGRVSPGHMAPYHAARQRRRAEGRCDAARRGHLRRGKPGRGKILGSPAILGATVTTDGTPVRDGQGVVVYRAVALVTRDVWERTQARLQANPVSAKVNTWTLTGIAFCAVCGAPMYSSGAVYHGKRYSYYGCVHSLRRDGECVARRVKAVELEAAISRELLALVGNVELTENKPVPGRDYTEDMRRVADQISHLSGEIALGAVSGRDVRADQETLQRAHAELARLAALKPVKDGVKPVKTGQTFRQKWETLDVTGRNEFLRAAAVRAVVSRDEMPPIENQAGPMTALDIPRFAIITDSSLHAVVYLGSLGDMLRRASDDALLTP